jgi:hypothetical protein
MAASSQLADGPVEQEILASCKLAATFQRGAPVGVERYQE